MKPFTAIEAVALPLIRDNIDTDAIIPSREMRSVSKSGLADGLFAGWRYRAIGGRDPDPAFALNQPAYADARILLAGANFGCGSSREHAAWALVEYGFEAVIAAGFNPIFRANAVRNGIVPVELAAGAIALIAAWVQADPQAHRVGVDLVAQQVTADHIYPFPMDEEAREMLLHGLDEIALTLRGLPAITAWREADLAARPWIYPQAG